VNDEQLAGRLRIPVPVVTAVRHVESGPRPNPHALRFEPRLFHHARPDLAPSFPYTPPKGTHDETTRAAFDRALVADAHAAVLCTSFGQFQTMGSHLLAVTHLDPVRAVGAFDAAPDGLSGDLFVDFCEHNPRFLDACRKDPPDFDEMALRYNGKASYAVLLRARYYAVLAG
jgi:hypothetical protein